MNNSTFDRTHKEKRVNNDTDEVRDYFKTLTKEELVEIAANQYADAQRLRLELDQATGVIR